MNVEDKIRQLEEQISRLSVGIHTSQQQLVQLQEELRLLKQEIGIPQAKRISPTPLMEGRQKLGLEHFIGLKLIHLVGIIVLVTGISIGVKYAIDGQLISETMRIGLAYAAGILLLILSLRLKKSYQLFSAILFSGSMASIYFTTYAAFAYYYFIHGTVAFLIMVALTVYTIFMAIRYNRKEIAIVGMVGAYGIPFLVSANSERVDLFFSYILLINLGIVFLSALCICSNAAASGLVFGWLVIMTLGVVFLFPSEKRLQQMLTIQALVVLLLFISFQWKGLIVTLLWVAVAVLFFVWGIIGKKSWVRLAAVFLVGLTLAKLLILDSQNFSAIQKITCYIAIGILLLLGSFYYQKLGLSEKKD